METASKKMWLGFFAGALLVASGAAALRKTSAEAPPVRREARLTPGACVSGAPRLEAFPRSPGGTPEVNAAWLAEHRCQVRVVDVREPEEIQQEGRIEGAEEVPLARILDAASRWSPEEPLVVVCRSGRRSAKAEEQLLSSGFRKVASLTGGMLGWTRLGLPVVPAAPGRPGKEGTPTTLTRALRQPSAATWTTAARLFASGTASCVDGRGETPVVGTPGGDVGDLLLSLAAIEDSAKHSIQAEHLDALLTRYVASFGRFYLHTDAHALERLGASLKKRPEFRGAQGRWTSAEELRRFVLAPPAELEAPLLEELVKPAHIGCGHLRLLSEHPEAYGVRRGLPEALLQAIFRHAFRHPDALDFVLLEGDHKEQGVLLVHVAEPVEAHTRVPMLTPHEGLPEYFVFHPEVAAYLRRETADFLVEQRQLLGLPVVHREPLHKALDRLGQQQLKETLRRLASGLPQIEVRLNEESPVSSQVHLR